MADCLPGVHDALPPPLHAVRRLSVLSIKALLAKGELKPQCMLSNNIVSGSVEHDDAAPLMQALYDCAKGPVRTSCFLFWDLANAYMALAQSVMRCVHGAAFWLAGQRGSLNRS